MNRKKVNDFSKKWKNKFEDKLNTKYQLFDDVSFADDCFSFDFKMDCGQEFIDNYGRRAFDDLDGLLEVIQSINELNILGSGVFSKWRYYNHWSDIDMEKDIDEINWFVVALTRLEELSK